MCFLLLRWDTVLTVGLSIVQPAVFVSQLFRDEMEYKNHCLESTRINIAQLLSIWEPEP